jgi:hypothetical protein
MEDREKKHHLSAGAPRIFSKQLRFDKTVWKTCQSRIMLKLLHQWMKFSHFYFCFHFIFYLKLKCSCENWMRFELLTVFLCTRYI